MTDTPTKPFSAVATAREMIDRAGTAALATLSASDGGPFASLVTAATDRDGSPILLLSTLAVHTANVAADNRVSLLFTEDGEPEPEADPLVRSRVTLTGRIGKVDEPEIRRRFLAHHPEAEIFVDFSDFAFYRMIVENAHLVAGFGRIVDVPAERLVVES